MTKSLLTTFAVLTAASGITFANDWPNFQGSTRLGIATEPGIKLEGWGATGPKIAWEKKLNEGFGGAAIVGDEAFIIDRDLGETDKLLCLNLADGSEKWSFTFDYPGKLPHAGSRGVPFVDDEAVYFIGGFGHVYRINRNTKKADWTLAIQDEYGAEPPKWGWAQSPVIVGDILITAAMSESAGLIGIDKNTGKEVWKTKGFGNSHSNPTIMTLQGVEQAVFVATFRENDAEIGTTISVEPKTGKVLWKTDAYFNKIPIPFPTKVTEEKVFLTGGYDNGSAMIEVKKNDSGGEWAVKKLYALKQGTQMHPPFVIGDHIYLLANENANHKGEARKTGGLMCLDFDGNTVWQTGDQPFMGRGNMILVNGKLLIQDGEVGYLRVVDPSPKGYKELAMADVFNKQAEVEETIAKQVGRATIKIPDFKYWSPMAISNGRLIMRGQEMLKCLDLRN